MSNFKVGDKVAVAAQFAEYYRATISTTLPLGFDLILKLPHVIHAIHDDQTADIVSNDNHYGSGGMTVPLLYLVKMV